MTKKGKTMGGGIFIGNKSRKDALRIVNYNGGLSLKAATSKHMQPRDKRKLKELQNRLEELLCKNPQFPVATSTWVPPDQSEIEELQAEIYRKLYSK